MTYRIAWKAKLTGATGQGTAEFPLPVARQIADDLNRGESGAFCFHYPVPAETEETNHDRTERRAGRQR